MEVNIHLKSVDLALLMSGQYGDGKQLDYSWEILCDDYCKSVWNRSQIWELG